MKSEQLTISEVERFLRTFVGRAIRSRWQKKKAYTLRQEERNLRNKSTEDLLHLAREIRSKLTDDQIAFGHRLLNHPSASFSGGVPGSAFQEPSCSEFANKGSETVVLSDSQKQNLSVGVTRQQFDASTKGK